VIWLDGQVDHDPSFFGTRRLNQRPPIKTDSASEHGVAALGCPDEVLDDVLAKASEKPA